MRFKLRNLPQRLFLGCLHFYQKGVSPLHRPCCRYVPSCSAYAVEAVERFGVVRGALAAVLRVLRCNPLCRGGYDPVPETFKDIFRWKEIQLSPSSCRLS
jgi:putative membrane protein insertion efficiency factor